MKNQLQKKKRALKNLLKSNVLYITYKCNNKKRTPEGVLFLLYISFLPLNRGLIHFKTIVT